MHVTAVLHVSRYVPNMRSKYQANRMAGHNRKSIISAVLAAISARRCARIAKAVQDIFRKLVMPLFVQTKSSCNSLHPAEFFRLWPKIYWSAAVLYLDAPCPENPGNLCFNILWSMT